MAGGIGLGTALDYLMEIGMGPIAAYEHDLIAYAERRLAEVDGLRFIGTPEQRAGASRSSSTASTRTTRGRSSTGSASPSAPASTARSR